MRVTLFAASQVLYLCLVLQRVVKGLDSCKDCVQGRVAVITSDCPSTGVRRVQLDVCGLYGGVNPAAVGSNPTCRFISTEFLELSHGGDGEVLERFLAAVATAAPIAVSMHDDVRFGVSSACLSEATPSATPPLTCDIPSENSNLAVTVAWEQPSQGLTGSNTSALWSALPAAVPTLLPNTISSIFATGNTTSSQVAVVLSGSSLRAPLECELQGGGIFPATVLNETSAICIIPSPAPSMLNIRGIPGCGSQNMMMSPPRLLRLGVVDVHPRRAKHVGSTELSVSLAPGALAWVLTSPLAVENMIFCRLVGAFDAGQGDLLMPGQLIRSEVPVKVGCSTPLSPQLPRISIPLEVGLGHTLFAPMVVNHSFAAIDYMDQGVETGEDHVLFSGPGLPVVTLVDHVSLVPANDSQVYIKVEMQGDSGVLVTARVQLRSNGKVAPLHLFPEGPIIESEVVWAPGVSGGQVVTLMLPFSIGEQQQRHFVGGAKKGPGMHVALCNVTNAEIGATSATELQLESELPVFGVLSPMQVLYVHDLIIDERVGLAPMTFTVGPLQNEVMLARPVVVGLELVALTPEWDGLLHLKREKLLWDRCGGRLPQCRPKNITVSIQADKINEKVYMRAMLRLNTSSNARVDPDVSSHALVHLIGSREGVCPVGTLCTSGGSSPWYWDSEEQEESILSPDPPLITGMSLGINSTISSVQPPPGNPRLALSPAFRPEITEYGVHVEQDVESIAIDIQTVMELPIHLEAVYMSAHVVLEPSVLGNLLMAGANVSDATALLRTQQGVQEVWNLTERPNEGYGANEPHRHRSLMDSDSRKDLRDGDYSGAGCRSSSPRLCNPLEKDGNATNLNGEDVDGEVGRVVEHPQEIKGGKLRWKLPLTVGKNVFRIVMSSTGEESGPGGSISGGESNSTAVAPAPYTLSVTRLANPSHVKLSSIRVFSQGQSTLLCMSTDLQSEQWKGWEEFGQVTETNGSPEPRACTPDVPMTVPLLNGSGEHFVQVKLAHEHVQGIRVEIGAQVLESSSASSVGGDIHTGSVWDHTLPQVPLTLVSSPLTVIPILVVAEDGVSSATYILRLQDYMWQEATVSPPSPHFPPRSPPQPRSAAHSAPGPDPSPTNSNTNDRDSSTVIPLSQFTTFPAAILPSSVTAMGECEGCPRGYFSSRPGAGRCGLCAPGSFAPALAARCYPCMPGRFSSSWGAHECLQCSKGTFTPWPGARACLLCPSNMTTVTSGASNCSVALDSTDLTRDFAVIVQLRVAFLVDRADLEDVSLRTGLIGSTEAVVTHLMRLDTAVVFGVPLGDVAVGLTILHDATEQSASGWASEFGNSDNNTIKDKGAASAMTKSAPSVNLTRGVDGATAVAVDLGLVTELPEDIMSWLGQSNRSDNGSDGGGGEGREASVVKRRLLTANVTATLAADVNLVDDSTEDIKAKVSVQELSADNGIELLAKSPDTFFLRTTKALNARPLVAPNTVHMEIHDPRRRRWFGVPIWAWISVGSCSLALLVFGMALCNSRLRLGSFWAIRWRRMPTLFSQRPSFALSTPTPHSTSSEMVPTSLASHMRLARLRSGLGSGGVGGEGLGLVTHMPSSSSPEWTVVELKER